MIIEILIGLGFAFLLIYFMLKKPKALSLDENISSKKVKLCTILYFITYSISLSIYYTRDDIYMRPLSYFLALSLMAVFVFCEIIYMPNSKVYKLLIILQIILIPLSFIFTQALMYGTLMGRDPWVHSYLTNIVIERGRIPEYLDENPATITYLKLPNFHLIITIFSILTNLGYKISSMISIGVYTLLLEILLIYLIGKNLCNDKIALLSALFLSLSDNVLDMVGKSIIPNSIGVAIVLLIFYLTFTLKPNANTSKPIIILISTFFLIGIHPLTYAFLLFQSVIFFLIVLLFKNNCSFQNLNTYFIISFVVGISYWMWISDYSFNQAINLITNFIKYTPSESTYLANVTMSIFQILISRLGMIIYFLFSMIGILWLVNNGKKYSHIATGAIAGAIIGMGFISFLTPALSGIAHRFWYYGEVLCGIPVSIALALFYLNLKRQFRIFITGAMVGILVFLMLTAPASNNDSPLVKSQTPRTGLQDSEISAAEFVISMDHDYPIASDSDYTQDILEIAKQRDVNFFAKFPRTFEEILNYNKNLFILRIKIFDRLFILGRSLSQNQTDLNEFAEELPGVKSALYNNGNVIIYL